MGTLVGQKNCGRDVAHERSLLERRRLARHVINQGGNVTGSCVIRRLQVRSTNETHLAECPLIMLWLLYSRELSVYNNILEEPAYEQEMARPMH